MVENADLSSLVRIRGDAAMYEISHFWGWAIQAWGEEGIVPPSNVTILCLVEKQARTVAKILWNNREDLEICNFTIKKITIQYVPISGVSAAKNHTETKDFVWGGVKTQESSRVLYGC